MTDPVETLARALMANMPIPEGKIWVQHQKNDALDQARALITQIAPALVAEAVKAEREACAAIADRKGWPGSMSEERYAGLRECDEGAMDCADIIAAAIRARTP